MTYIQAIEYIKSCYSPSVKHGHDTLLAVLRELGSPQEGLKIIHVAGTNGKGSSCAMLASVLKAAGYKTALFTSPHLTSYNERFQINGGAISDESLAHYASRVRAACAAAFGDADSRLSFFELLTAMAFCWFHDERADYAVMEVGLGGELDPTNVIKKPLLSIITAVGLDHTELLGDTLGEIAAAKAGIIKKNCPALLYYQSDLVYNVVKKEAALKRAELFCVKAETEIIGESLGGTVFSAHSELFDYPRVETPLLGGFQVYNAAGVLSALHVLMKTGNAVIPEKAILSGIRKARWPGRFEIISQNPLFVADGAHNMDGVAEFCRSARKYFAGREITVISGMMREKNCGGMINALAGLADNLIITKPSYGSRAAGPEALAAEITRVRKIFAENDYKKAVGLARRITPKNGVIACCGSLYLVGDVRKFVLKGE